MGYAKWERTKRSNKVRELLYSTFKGNRATRYGSTMEGTAKQQYITYQRQNNHPDCTVTDCGFFISENNNWLAATPDGIAHNPSHSDYSGLIEIKNPFAVKDQTVAEVCTSSSFCLEIDKNSNKPQLKRRHDYYFQVQCQLYCTDKGWCDFVLRTKTFI